MEVGGLLSSEVAEKLEKLRRRSLIVENHIPFQYNEYIGFFSLNCKGGAYENDSYTQVRLQFQGNDR